MPEFKRRLLPALTHPLVRQVVRLRPQPPPPIERVPDEPSPVTLSKRFDGLLNKLIIPPKGTEGTAEWQCYAGRRLYARQCHSGRWEGSPCTVSQVMGMRTSLCTLAEAESHSPSFFRRRHTDPELQARLQKIPAPPPLPPRRVPSSVLKKEEGRLVVREPTAGRGTPANCIHPPLPFQSGLHSEVPLRYIPARADGYTPMSAVHRDMNIHAAIDVYVKRQAKARANAVAEQLALQQEYALMREVAAELDVKRLAGETRRAILRERAGWTRCFCCS
ncbi:unnamed protein product [Vitrella brassicaformis CCMP3155]|uniref:Uncharacterized protein n=2 Tax=Vitrella brassicaformis TaxID=1169539 RepID=A0A0G4FXU8_VITBC|nr:unnamed protein product [Vitrella brassicaformis CCMP3155]|eukprot:CEM20248.1 unnamed protein product [Vitrella brassicaformis CCMP3155]